MTLQRHQTSSPQMCLLLTYLGAGAVHHISSDFSFGRYITFQVQLLHWDFSGGAQANKHMKTTHTQHLLMGFASDRQTWSSSDLKSKNIIRIPSFDKMRLPGVLAQEHAEKCCHHAGVIPFSTRQIYNRCYSAVQSHGCTLLLILPVTTEILLFGGSWNT